MLGPRVCLHYHNPSWTALSVLHFLRLCLGESFATEYTQELELLHERTLKYYKRVWNHKNGAPSLSASFFFLLTTSTV